MSSLNRFNFGLVFALFGLTLCLSGRVYAEDPPPAEDSRNNVISGEIKLESTENKKDVYKTSAEEALSFLTNLRAKVGNAGSGNAEKIEVLDEDATTFLTAAYLYCNINEGVCPFFLESLFEADLINAHLENSSSCPSLRLFWKKYLENDLEGRHKHSTKIGFLTQTADFNQKVRPKYIKCQKTIKAELEKGKGDPGYLKSRYSNGAAIKSIDQTIEYLKMLEAKKINVFAKL